VPRAPDEWSLPLLRELFVRPALPRLLAPESVVHRLCETDRNCAFAHVWQKLQYLNAAGVFGSLDRTSFGCQRFGPSARDAAAWTVVSANFTWPMGPQAMTEGKLLFFHKIGFSA
jgi:hypothetical protein